MEQALLEICRKLPDPRRILEEAFERHETFKRATVAECCDRYIDEYKDRDSAMTRHDATSKAGVIRETLGERYLDSLTERDIEEWRDTKLKGTKRYRNNILAHLRHLFERARVWGFVPKGHNPAREVSSLKIPRAEPVVWEPETLKACLKYYWEGDIEDAGGRIAFLALGAFAGMRPSEIEGASLVSGMDCAGRTSISSNGTSAFAQKSPANLPNPATSRSPKRRAQD
jgi:integrase